MKKIKLILTMAVVMTIMSFKTVKTLETGAYGICDCEENTVITTKHELIINDDFSFRYFNSSNSKKKIDIEGRWTREGNVVYLQDYESEHSIHNKWTIDKNEKCLKSRKGLSFVRLCNRKPCDERQDFNN